MSFVKQLDTFSLLGVRVHRFTVDSYFEMIGDCIVTKTPCVIGHHNLHSVYLYHHDAAMKLFYDTIADYIFIDGMPLVLWGKTLGFPLARENRFTGVDWLPLLMDCCAKHGWRVFYLGGRSAVMEAGITRLQTRYQGLAIAGHNGYFEMTSEDANRRILETISSWRTELLLVGMGMPRQERWIMEQRHHLNVPCIVPVGAAFDYVAGAIPTPPRWLSRLAFEWVARLAAEPRRLGQRYLLEPWFLLPYVIADANERVRKR
jgi:N-acetylglucosaminyldiphosphoundecaprenol N-acetyl-beta-D-mannosaminyltransferase